MSTTQKCLLLLLLAVSSLASSAMAQDGSIVGEIVESSSQEPLFGATLVLYARGDTTFIMGAVTNDLGEFELMSVADGSYDLEISYVGFVTQKLPVDVEGEEVDLDVIELAPTQVLLEGVTVTGEVAPFVNNIDKRVYDVNQDLLAEAGSASEVLQNIPLISVDINGAISLRGTGNVTIFINGRPSAMLRRNAATVLAQLPANSIERIEIITNPSARYRPDGIGGIINIVMREDTQQGLNGRITPNIGTEKRYNVGLALNYGKENFNIFGDYVLRHAEGVNVFDDERIFRQNRLRIGSYDESGESTIDALSHTITAGLNFNLNDYNTVELGGTYFRQSSMHDVVGDISTFDAQSNPTERLKNTQTNDEFEGEGEASFAFEHIFQNSEDHSLTVEAAYAAFSEHEDLAFNQVYTLPEPATEVEKIYIAKSGNQSEIVVDYAVPLGDNSELEAGYSGEFIDEDIRYTNPDGASQFLFDQQVHAGYGLLGHSIENFSISVGLRAEQTNITSHLVTPGNLKTPNDYFKLFPTAHLGYEFSETETITLSYSKRINRPDSDQLNPRREFSDPRNAEEGNASLKPEQVHSFEFAYQSIGEKVTFSPTVYYRHLYDAFTTIQYSLGDSVIVTRIENLNTQEAAGFETVLSLTPTSDVNLDLAGNVFYTIIDAANIGYTDNKSVITGDLRANLLYKFTGSTTLQLNGFYYFPQITPQGRRDRYYYLNGGLSQQLFNNKASLTLTATDIFHTYKEQRTIDSNVLSQVAGLKRKMPVVYFGFTWRFNTRQSEEMGYEGEGLRR